MGVQHCRWYWDLVSGDFKDLLTMRCTFNGYCLFHMMNVKKKRAKGIDLHIGIMEKTSVGRLLVFLVPG
jgi:hypothetical protein